MEKEDRTRQHRSQRAQSEICLRDDDGDGNLHSVYPRRPHEPPSNLA
jgi:hypothetical protein